MKAFLTSSLLACLYFAVPVQAGPIIAATSIAFDGTCALMDCTGHGKGTLTVVGTFTGTNTITLTTSDFVSFVYAGTNLLPAFTILNTNLVSASGTLGPSFPAAYTVAFSSALYSFSSSTSGTWSILRNGQVADQGSASSFSTAGSPVPEPASVALIGAGLLGLFMARKKLRP